MAIDIVARALAVSGKQSLENYYTKTESDAKYSQATNLENGTGTGSLVQTATTYNALVSELVPDMLSYVINSLHYTAPPTSESAAQATLTAMGFTETQVSALIGAVGYTKSVAVGILIGSGFYTQTEAATYIITNGTSSEVVATALVKGLFGSYEITETTDLSNKAYSAQTFAMGGGSVVNSPGGVSFGFNNKVGEDGNPMSAICSLAVGLNLKNFEKNSAMFGTGKSEYKIEGSDVNKAYQRIYLDNLKAAGGDVKGSGDSRVGVSGVNKGFNSLLSGFAHWNGAINSTIFGNQNIIGEHAGYNYSCANNFIGNGQQNFIDRSLNCGILGEFCKILNSNSTYLFGRLLLANGRRDKTVVGVFNEDKANTHFEVGNGTGVKRSNAFEVLKDGRAKVQSAPTESDDVVRLNELFELTQEQVDSLF